VEPLDPDDCRAYLHLAAVGRVGTTIGALPAVLPVRYEMLDDHVVFRVAPGTRLTAAVLGAPVAFEVDHLDEEGPAGWSVMVVGQATDLVDGELARRARALELAPWSGPRDHLVGIPTDYVTGRRIATGDDPPTRAVARYGRGPAG
jgi:nitroimidazol reductase NimA-like FMN-containing flavoprotein (pyridoxamine 5'-phosphate oxidase superfamily)